MGRVWRGAQEFKGREDHGVQHATWWVRVSIELQRGGTPAKTGKDCPAGTGVTTYWEEILTETVGADYERKALPRPAQKQKCVC